MLDMHKENSSINCDGNDLQDFQNLKCDSVLDLSKVSSETELEWQ